MKLEFNVPRMTNKKESKLDPTINESSQAKKKIFFKKSDRSKRRVIKELRESRISNKGFLV